MSSLRQTERERNDEAQLEPLATLTEEDPTTVWWDFDAQDAAADWEFERDEAIRDAQDDGFDGWSTAPW